MKSNSVILIVDDEKTILDSVRGQLRSAFGGRFSFETAQDALEAWEVIDGLHARGVQVVAVLSDWLMPGQRGDAFLTDLYSRFPAIGRILLTGQADADALRRAWDVARVCEVVSKPWSADVLRRAIELAVPKE